MQLDDINDVNITAQDILISPEELKRNIVASETGKTTVRKARKTIRAILDRHDHRFLVIAGPCSIHDEKAAKEYAVRLKKLHDELHDSLYIVMRVYFEKPRTTVGWKGYINDPYLDDSFRMVEGLEKARALLVWMAELGLPTATEALDPITPQYLADLFAWSAIGARTSESQTHREMASGLSMPVGFKNGTDGNLDVAINALKSAASAHNFLGINPQGQVAVIQTRGNKYGHIILRGGKEPNYQAAHIAACEQALQKAKLPCNIIVDCSHGNSDKKPELQPRVVEDLQQQIAAGNHSIIGLMLESHLHAGNQAIPTDLSQLKYGVSVTDACIDWETTETLLRQLHTQLQHPLIARLQPQAEAV